jgi:FkbH-like protein
MNLDWLPTHNSWNEALRHIRTLPVDEAVPQMVALANYSMDFLQTARLDTALRSFGMEGRALLRRCPPVKLAMLGSSTLSYLAPGIRVAALRRGFAVEIFEGEYGMYRQELADSSSPLYEFAPDVVLLAFDAHHVAQGEAAAVGPAIERMRTCWTLAREGLHATVIQQTVLPVFAPVLGSNEHCYKLSPHTVVEQINQQLRVQAEAEGISLLSVDHMVQADGVAAWFNPALWHRAKQEINPALSPLYGDHVGRLLAALRGLSSKCLVLDLDNTLWGGVIGDDGLEGILLGQGHAVGEGFISFQRYVKSLALRGVILAVCSKNDMANATLPFESHPEMVLRSSDIACFVANWQDKAANLRHIAETLNVGLDSLVFADDNPFERNLIRQELPMVQVPELPDDPALYETTLAAAGYFEALNITSEDRERVALYRENSERRRLEESSTDMQGYLASLNMVLTWSAFDRASLARVVQLINKSNQFNLTTRRYTQEQVLEMATDPDILTLQLRLKDSFGDNGLIAVVIGKVNDDTTLELDTWLMSCRVLGRQVEEATLNLIAEQASSRGLKRIVGVYLPTSKNNLVKNHYERLGFQPLAKAAEQTSRDPVPDSPLATRQTNTEWVLYLDSYQQRRTPVTLAESLALPMEGTLDRATDLYAAD